MIINFPNKVIIDTENIPDNFDELIKRSFAKYTEGTAEECTYMDKLAYIDRCRELLHRSFNEEERVLEMMTDYFEYEVMEHGEIPEKSDFTGIEFLAACYRAGKTDLHSHYSKTAVTNEKILKLLVRMIKVVINYEVKDD